MASAANPDWAKPASSERDGPEADLVVRSGDIDNLGFGWPQGFDPFSGESTEKHPYPFKPAAGDPQATDRIMVISGFRGGDVPMDGYTGYTQRPGNRVQALQLAFDTAGIEFKRVLLQLFVDDFQAPSLKSRFSVTLDGRDAPDIARTLNQLDQTGPIGKLVTVRLLPEYLPALADGRLDILIDDAVSDIGDGYAVDFARLLVNPKPWKNSGSVHGRVVVAGTDTPIAGVLVSAGNVREAASDSNGAFVLNDVPAGLVVATGSHPAYSADSETFDLLSRQSVEIVLELTPAPSSSASLGEQLDSMGKADLYGIYFDTDQASLKDTSEATLQQVRGLLAERPRLRVVIAGHTDAEGSDAHNQSLSERRAAAVVAWLTAQGIAAARLQSEGHGESQPVADNASAAGRALNRRVEIRDARR